MAIAGATRAARGNPWQPPRLRRCLDPRPRRRRQTPVGPADRPRGRRASGRGRHRRVDHRRHVLLLRQYHHTIDRVLLGLPAGTLEPGEEAAATAARELTEETGYVADRLTELVSYYTSPGYTNERLTIFRADGCRPAGIAPDPDELIRLAPVPLAEIPQLIAPGPDQVQEGKTLIGLLLLLRDEAAARKEDNDV